MSKSLQPEVGQADPFTPMGIVAGYGKFFRAARSPYPQQRRAVRMIMFGAAAFLAFVTIVAFAATR